MQWLEIAVSATHEAAEAVYAVLSEYAPGAVAIEEPVLQDSDGDGAQIDFSRPVRVSAYVPIDGEEASKRECIERGVWHLSQIAITGVGEVETRTMEEQDWANAWKAHYHTRHVGRHLVITPSWQQYTPQPGEVVVELDPGMAFGTGLHPTTDTCLRLLEDTLCTGDSVLDVGTGSAILALAAAGLGASSVVGVDTETVAVEAAAANVQQAGMAGRIRIARGSLPLPASLAGPEHGRPGPSEQGVVGAGFDLVLANIIARVLVELAADLRAVLRPQGKLIASGIIAEREDDVLRAFTAAGLRLERRVQAEDWVTLLCTPSGG
ncbi:MAG: 50S ribosomal protein L11 methyltransferase [Chloroflexota bacterium]